LGRVSIQRRGVRRRGEKAGGGQKISGPDSPELAACQPRPKRSLPVTTEARSETMRFLGYTLADPSTPIPPPSPEMMSEMGGLIEEATKAGVLVATGGLGPVEEATKVTYKDGEFTVLDGPFTEAKELIGGWALLEVRDKAEAIEWTKRFLRIAGDGESTIRQVFGP